MTRVLGVGIATVDIINVTDGFPAEDAEVRAISQHIRRGGNIGNSLVVLSQLGHQCHWCGSLAEDDSASIIRRDFEHYGVTLHAEIHAAGRTPTSYITLNQENGSRTIVHYRDLEELACSAFTNCPLETVEWCHFEGRNVSQVAQMQNYLRDHFSDVPVSIEIEKPREEIECLIEAANLVFFSRHYASSLGYSQARNFLADMHRRWPNNILVCTWGEAGANAIDLLGVHHHQAAAPVGQVIDTVGAGDTFIAGFLHQWWLSKDIPSALQFAAELAAMKCAQLGFGNLLNKPVRPQVTN